MVKSQEITVQTDDTSLHRCVTAASMCETLRLNTMKHLETHTHTQGYANTVT